LQVIAVFVRRTQRSAIEGGVDLQFHDVTQIVSFQRSFAEVTRVMDHRSGALHIGAAVGVVATARDAHRLQSILMRSLEIEQEICPLFLPALQLAEAEHYRSN
jgi:hypothetical protein